MEISFSDGQFYVMNFAGEWELINEEQEVVENDEPEENQETER